MARKRMIDPEFWADEEIGSTWSHSARLFYIAIWNFCDDEGRFRADDRLLRSQIFPYDDEVDIAELKRQISTKIVWYTHERAQYGWCRNFHKHQSIQKPRPSILPPPPAEDNIDRNAATQKRQLKDAVLLSKLEYDNLVQKLGVDKTAEYIDKLNNYIMSRGKQRKYKSHYHTILNWSRRENAETS